MAYLLLWCERIAIVDVRKEFAVPLFIAISNRKVINGSERIYIINKSKKVNDYTKVTNIEAKGIRLIFTLPENARKENKVTFESIRSGMKKMTFHIHLTIAIFLLALTGCSQECEEKRANHSNNNSYRFKVNYLVTKNCANSVNDEISKYSSNKKVDIDYIEFEGESSAFENLAGVAIIQSDDIVEINKVLMANVRLREIYYPYMSIRLRRDGSEWHQLENKITELETMGVTISNVIIGADEIKIWVNGMEFEKALFSTQ
jgi:hypothetical protein